MLNERFDSWEHEARWVRDEVRFDSVRFFRNANDLIGLFDVWKRMDRFYFIPIKPRLGYAYHQIKMTDEELYLGTFVRCILEHEDLFTGQCPECGRKVYPYGYHGNMVGSDAWFYATCPCGWKGTVAVQGAGLWLGYLKEAQRADKRRMRRIRVFRPFFKAATVELLMDYLW